jgi:hypothetical protein
LALNERARRDLHRKLEEVLGEENALTMMENLGRGEPATKGDLRHEIGLVRKDLRLVEADLRHEIGLVRKDLEVVEERLRREMHQGFGDLRKDMVTQIGTQTRVLMFSTISAVVAVGSIAVAAGRFV